MSGHWGAVQAIWLILTGLLALVPALAFAGSAIVLAVLALISGILILLGR